MMLTCLLLASLQGIPTVKGRWGAQMMSQLEVRAAAHRRWGSEAALKAAQERAAEKARVMQEAREERAAEEKRQRIEQTELRWARELVNKWGARACEGGNRWTSTLTVRS